MDLTIKDLSSEQYEKICKFSQDLVGKKYFLSIFRDDYVDFDEEVALVFDTPEIEDVKIMNNLRDHKLCPKYECDFDKDELIEDGYCIFYLEATIHSGIWLYEYNGSLRDRWDSGIAGIVAIKCKDRHFAYKVFKDFITTWQKCSDGDFYGFRIEDNFGEVVDSCCGFWDTNSIKEYMPDYITEQQFSDACNNIKY